MLQPNRTFSAGSYRYGFSGKEMDNEVKGFGAQYDYGFRIYDPKIVRFFSVDPLAKSYPWYTPYQYAGNKSIQAIDIDGQEELIVIRWFDGKYYRGETIFRVHNQDQRESGRQAGGDMQLIELPASQRPQFDALVKSKDISKVEPYLKYEEGNFKGDHFKAPLEQYQTDLATLKKSDESSYEKNSYLFPGVFKETVYFKKGTTDINVDLSPKTLGLIQKELNDNKELKLTITGFASVENNTGDPEYNNKLAQNRAEEVKKYLIAHGIDKDRILFAEGAGATDQFDKKDKSQNRRAEISYTYAKRQP